MIEDGPQPGAPQLTGEEATTEETLEDQTAQAPTQIASGIDAPSANVVKAWPGTWRGIQPGAPKSALIAAMGPPTDQFTDSARWEGYGWQFNAFYDENGNVRQMDINTISLSAPPAG